MFYKTEEGINCAAGGASQRPLPYGETSFRVESGSADGIGRSANVSGPRSRSRQKPNKKRRRQKAKR